MFRALGSPMRFRDSDNPRAGELEHEVGEPGGLQSCGALHLRGGEGTFEGVHKGYIGFYEDYIRISGLSRV